MKTMIVVGGGAAGMMTAIHAAEHYRVTLLEKNEKLGRKLFITGKGRCNLTNACDEDTFLRQVMSNPKFLYSAAAAYPPELVMQSFDKWGLSMKTERGNRVFPKSDHSSDVIRTLEKEMQRRGASIRLNERVISLITEEYMPIAEENEDTCEGSKKKNVEPIALVKGVKLSTGEKLYADKVVLATGGISYSGTGASGECVKLLEDLGISVRPFQPSLVPFESDVSICRPMMGLSLKNVEVNIYRTAKPKKPVYTEFGEMLFTHFGISGPIILSASGKLQKFFTADGKPLEELWLEIDWKPALDNEQLDARILREFDTARNKTVQNAVETLLPRLAVPVMLKAAGLDPEKRVHDVTQEERRKLVDALKHFRLPVLSLRGFDEAIISAGGVAVKEIDPHTMELRRLPGLRVAGEMIDCDALTGGFNLQIAWCTAYLAATGE